MRRSVGRPRGALNKRTRRVREAFDQAFSELGGVDALVAWGRENPRDFYRLYSGKIPDSILNLVAQLPEVASR